MRGILAISISVAGILYVCSIPPIFDLKTYTEGTLWTLRLLLSVTMILIGAITIIALLVKHCSNLKDTFVNEQTEHVKQLKDKILILENKLMVERQENSIPTIPNDYQ